MGVATIHQVKLEKKTRCTFCRAKLIDGQLIHRLISPKGKIMGNYCNRPHLDTDVDVRRG
jgi:hypothetical protein